MSADCTKLCGGELCVLTDGDGTPECIWCDARPASLPPGAQDPTPPVCGVVMPRTNPPGMFTCALPVGHADEWHDTGKGLCGDPNAHMSWKGETPREAEPTFFTVPKSPFFKPILTEGKE